MTGGRRERADAARNRRAILCATEELLARYRPEQISMEQVATAAGVGKGTVFHRFGNRMGLMRALMEERALTLGESVATGPPPLGPGAPPRERLLAFLDAMVYVVTRNKGLIAALDHAMTTAPKPAGDSPAAAQDAHPVYTAWHRHISTLITAERPDLDAELLAHVLLSALHSDPILDLLRQGEGHRLTTSLHTLATAILDAPPRP
ncbi:MULTISPECIES: TetR/AcrR family transcriptional regulator [unclassified Streptomyces]|uniref:TetR/AcrR family transcriptional regulator n=1 Tax=unclassified Streptomyces TaxID=2593676 RepID=UPI00336A8FC4